MKRTPLKSMIALSAFAVVAGCGSDNPGTVAWNVEAGALVDEGYFGNATMNNTLIHNGERSYLVNMSERFAREVPTTITFAFNSAALDSAAKQVLRQQADFIRQFPEVRFSVYGHADAVGSDRYNRALGKRRANAVVHYLSSLGISRNRLEALVSYGETQPLVVSQGKERRNRRTVTEVSGFVGAHPTVMDGKYAQIVYRDYVGGANATTELSGVEAEGQ
ncbi:OmpA family protein [Nereida sp. MMG025]|uniref:OmpA family protein n=1 Tax=Nereida sp. MMG025 TaxID=2909981 RepID=UPI001F2C7026|nr:OmpA family protein [Nereida sp. MMG025]MCF6445002.1 OmpA family protein [Nereida sp. MMG025]